MIFVLFLLAKNKDKLLPRQPRNYQRNYPESLVNRPEIIWQDRTIPPQTSPRNTTNETPNIAWRDIPVDDNSSNLDSEIGDFDDIEEENEPDFLDVNNNFPLETVLQTLIDCRDPFTQEKFKSGDEIYFCSRCTVAYHKDSWEEMGKKCNNCHNDNHTQLYKLPNHH